MKKVAIIVGHTPRQSGCHNFSHDVSEFDFNNEFSSKLAKALRLSGYQPIVLYRNNYRGLPNDVNSLKVDIGISLHCNAFNTSTSGSEVLYWHGSSNGKVLAQALQEQITKALGNNDRGIKPIDYDTDPSKNDNGGWLVEKTSMPVVITEAFFLDNDVEYENAIYKLDKLVEAYVIGVQKYFSI